MKTALLIDSTGPHYFQRRGGLWRPAGGASRKDSLWVLVNLPEESLEVIDMPRLFGSDRNSFLERRLTTAFPENAYRATHILSGGPLKPGKVMLTGLTTVKELTGILDTLDTPIAGVWGIAALLAIMAKQLAAPDVLLVLPSEDELRILVVKNKVPVLTRCVHREGDSNADEILLTRQYLENQRVFERGKPPPVLFLGDTAADAARLANAGLTLLPVPKAYLPKGETGWLHPFLDRLASSPSGQLAPIPMRARYLAGNVRRAAYGGAAAGLIAVSLYGQGDFRAYLELHQREQVLQTEVQGATAERNRLAALIKDSGADPELVRRATQFEEREITAAPGVETFLLLAAAAISDLPEARITALSFHLAPDAKSSCQNTGAEAPGISPSGRIPPPSGLTDPEAGPKRQAEVQLTVMLPAHLSPRAKIEARKRITVAIQGVDGITLLHDPALAARSTTLTGGTGAGLDQTEESWCMSVPWKTPAVVGKELL